MSEQDSEANPAKAEGGATVAGDGVDKDTTHTGSHAATPGAPGKRFAQRRWLIPVIVAVVILLLACVALVTILTVVGRAIDRAGDQSARVADARHHTNSACLALERRLNRLAPPGTSTQTSDRAKAIRDENAAVRPFLVELDQVGSAAPRDADDERGRRSAPEARWIDGWRQLIDARASYADALDRQTASGEPAFYLPPKDARSEPVAESLIREGPDPCDGPLRRLSAPDL